MSPEELVDLFRTVGVAVRDAVSGIERASLRDRTGHPGQYALDLVADAAALAVLAPAPVAILSEESGHRGDPDTALTVVLDPVDGSTNCARGIAYWATSVCAVDGDGVVASLVVNQATGSEVVARRGAGAWRDGVRLHAATTERVEDAVVALSGVPRAALPWRQHRVLGCASLGLCEVAAGGVDAYLDTGPWHAPWDYLGAYLACREAGATVTATDGAPLVTTDGSARRQVVAAGTGALIDALAPAVGGGGA